jgi:Eisosome component PIL1
MRVVRLHPRNLNWRFKRVFLRLIRTLPGHAFRKNTAGAFGPDLAKKLSQLVKMEKNVMRSMELVGRERMEVAVCQTELFAPYTHAC